MQKMESCCVQGCYSYKQSELKNIGYFKFPLHDVLLLKKWLQQMRCGNWKPSEMSQICSVHFKEKDLDRPLNKKYPFLLPDSVPTIFPFENNPCKNRRFEEDIIEITDTNESNMRAIDTSDCSKPHRNEVSFLWQKKKAEKKSGIDKESKDISAGKNVGFVTSDSLSSQKSFPRIIINKERNGPTSSKSVPFETIFLPFHGEDEITAPDILRTEENNRDSKNNVNPENNFSICDHSAYSKPMMLDTGRDRSRTHVRQYINKSKQKTDFTSQINEYYEIEAVSQDHIYSCRPKREVQSISSKEQEEIEGLRKRLGGLRRRRKREELKIIKLQKLLCELEKQMKENNEEEIVLPNLGQSSHKLGGVESSWLIREKEEYEKLLKDVREMKLRVLRDRHNRELERIKMLQMQMTNLRQKMRKNDKKEMVLYNSRQTDNWAVAKLDWMIKEEEEYEKLLLDVRKIKQSYKLSESERKDSVKSNPSIRAIKCENVLSSEDCILIETMQKEIQNGNKSRRDIQLMEDDNDEYGEVIGEIDEDSINIDMSRETMILNFNEELPDPGLIES